MPSALLRIFAFLLFNISACESLNAHTDSWREERQVCNVIGKSVGVLLLRNENDPCLQYANALNEAESALVDAEKIFSSLSFESREGWKKV